MRDVGASHTTNWSRFRLPDQKWRPIVCNVRFANLAFSFDEIEKVSFKFQPFWSLLHSQNMIKHVRNVASHRTWQYCTFFFHLGLQPSAALAFLSPKKPRWKRSNDVTASFLLFKRFLDEKAVPQRITSKLDYEHVLYFVFISSRLGLFNLVSKYVFRLTLPFILAPKRAKHRIFRSAVRVSSDASFCHSNCVCVWAS